MCRVRYLGGGGGHPKDSPPRWIPSTVQACQVVTTHGLSAPAAYLNTDSETGGALRS